MGKEYKGIFAALILGIIYGGTSLLCGFVNSVDDALIGSCLADFSYSMTNTSRIPYYYFPYMLFQVLYCNYISVFFSDSGIYYFSRIKSRSVWLLKKCARLCLGSFLYPAVFTLTKACMYWRYFPSSMDIKGWWYTFAYFIVIYGLFLFSCTLLINIITIAKSGSESIILVVLGELTGSAVYCLMGQYLPDPDYITGFYQMFFKMNPFGNLAFYVHTSKIPEVSALLGIPCMEYDLNDSVLYFGILSLIILIIGMRIVVRKSFLRNKVDV